MKGEGEGEEKGEAEGKGEGERGKEGGRGRGRQGCKGVVLVDANGLTTTTLQPITVLTHPCSSSILIYTSVKFSFHH